MPTPRRGAKDARRHTAAGVCSNHPGRDVCVSSIQALLLRLGVGISFAAHRDHVSADDVQHSLKLAQSAALTTIRSVIGSKKQRGKTTACTLQQRQEEAKTDQKEEEDSLSFAFTVVINRDTTDYKDYYRGGFG